MRTRATISACAATPRERRTHRFDGITALVSVAAVLLSACAEDTILPVDATCGNFEIESGEECDVDHPGCEECLVVPGFRCDDLTCTTVCGDGVVIGDEQCDPPDGIACDTSCRAAAKEEACDMNGYWIVRQEDRSIDDVLSQIQTSSNWYVFRLSQTADVVQVEESILCGIRVTGTADVDLTPGGIRGLMYPNPQFTQPRRGTFVQSGDTCSFTFDRHYIVRGVEPRFLPPVFADEPPLASLEPLPTEANPQREEGQPWGENLDGAIDSDGDGVPGVLYRISGNASGSRNVVQRDWNQYRSDDQFVIPTNAIEFVARSEYDNEENIILVEGCPLLGCGILLAGSAPATNEDNPVVFRYLGKDLADPRVAEIIVAPMREDEDADFETCENVRAALLHDDPPMIESP